MHIYLPRATARARESEAPTRAPGQGKASGARILLVDDDNAVRDVTAETLRDFGYRVIEAGSGGAALDTLAREAEIDLILIDFAMPGMNGAELSRQIQSRRPGLPILFVTGFADRTALAGISESHIVGKPFVNDELAEKVRAILSQDARNNVVTLRR
jgi:CheY-like chemotaxis protein